MEDDNDYWDHQRPGLKKTVARGLLSPFSGCFSVLPGLSWPSEPKSISFTTAEADCSLSGKTRLDRGK